ncbi:hypothetical protein [Pseudomonas lundensis]|uniref:hypothetical protein n=1 Tax=Pseudomonas lundensis TaxID=86185 RepID=UPI0021CCD0D5|nr:hypothetical protein [Pseudomonas lundensis]
MVEMLAMSCEWINFTAAERQADRFAACFFMPQKLVREGFEFMFCCIGRLRFSGVIAYHLDPINPNRLLYAPKESK